MPSAKAPAGPARADRVRRVYGRRGSRARRRPAGPRHARLVRPQPQDPLRTQWGLAGRPRSRSASGVGLVRIGQPELVAAGLSPTVDPRRLQLFTDGIEQAFSGSGNRMAAWTRPTASSSSHRRGYALHRHAGEGLAAGERWDSHRRVLAPGAGGVRRRELLARAAVQRTIDLFRGLRNGDEENGRPLVSVYEPIEVTLRLSHIDHEHRSRAAEIEVALQGVTIASGDAPIIASPWQSTASTPRVSFDAQNARRPSALPRCAAGGDKWSA